jgi:SAM-dependent methyltransferase
MTMPLDPAALSKGQALKHRCYPESRLSGFSNLDGTLAFYSQIAALLRPEAAVLEFGAGRGANIAEVDSAYLRGLQILRGRCARVAGCDVDPVVLENPFLDDAAVIAPGQPLPYPDASFDLIVSSWVFEHIAEPRAVAAELLRVLKPGGTICACTPNKWGYISLAARLVRNRQHAAVLRKVQPGRQTRDVFPTVYRMNTAAALRQLFGPGAEVVIGRTSAEPSYHFNNRLIYFGFYLLHKLLPASLATTLHVYVRKPAAQDIGLAGAGGAQP